MDNHATTSAVSPRVSRWHLLLALPREISPHRAWWMMAIITLIAALLRAAALSYPPALTDEAFTFWRICGTSGQMLDILRDDAFVPLHYQVLWVLTKVLGTDLGVMRLPSAVAGVVLPFAIYRLGRLVGGRRAGATAALIASTSEFLAYFARNAKMYMPAWTLMTLAIGSLLFAARAPKTAPTRRLAYLTFIFFGVAATSMHAVVCIPLALSPVLAVTWGRRRRLQTLLISILATALVLAAPILYYSAINTWFAHAGGLSNRVDDGPAQRDNGLMWIASWQSHRSPQNVLLECLSAYIGGFEWPEDHETFDSAMSAKVQRWVGSVMIGLIFGAVVAVINATFRHRGGLSVAQLISCLLLIALPFYGFYLRSYRGLAPPWKLGWIAWAVVAFSCIAIFVGIKRCTLLSRRRFGYTLGWLALLTTILTVTWTAALFAYSRAPHGSDGVVRWNPLWMPRYSGFIAPVLCVLIGGVVAAIPTAVLRWSLAGALIGVNLWLTVLCIRTDTEVPWPLIVRDVVASSRGVALEGVGADTKHSAVALGWVRAPGQPFMSILPAPYYDLIRSTGADVDPPGFRNGVTWPYRPGPQVRTELAKLRYLPITFLAATAAKNRLNEIVLWRTVHDSDATSNPLAGWHTVDRQNFLVRFVWNWQTTTTYERLVLKKD